MQNGFATLPTGHECAVTATTSQGTQLRGQCQRLTRHLVVFEVCGPDGQLLVSEALNNFAITLDGQTVYFGKAAVKKLVSTGRIELCEAELGEGWKDADPFARLAHPAALAGDFHRYFDAWHSHYQVLAEFKIHLADMQMFFSELRLWLDQVEMGLRAVPERDRDDLASAATAQVAASAIPLINDLFGKFESIAERVDEDLKPLHRAYMKRQLHPLLMCAPFAHRAFTKPLGYPGDYEMVNMIVRNGHEGNSLYAKVVNCWFLSQLPAEAHRNRLQHLAGKITGEIVSLSAVGRPARLFNLACGPAHEIQELLHQPHLSDRAEITLLDFNQETLDYAAARIAEAKKLCLRSAPVRCVRKSVQQLLKEAGRLSDRLADEQYDMVYCAGLFDYLADPVCQRLMDLMYSWLAPGGLLLATNLAPSNPMRHGMDYLLDWNLVYRDARQALKLRPIEAPEDTVSVRSDMTGVNLFIEVRKPGHAH